MRGKAAAKTKQEALRDSRKLASSVLACRATSCHADRNEDLAERPSVADVVLTPVSAKGEKVVEDLPRHGG